MEINEDDMDRACSTHVEITNAYKMLVVEPQWKRPSRRPRHWWKNNIRTELRKVWCEGVDWIELDRNRVQWRTFV